MIRTKIISAFPGMGKTYYCNNTDKLVLDSDSSNFSWKENTNKKERHPDFPQNYINHIKENIGKVDYIFVSTHKDVRDALLDNCLFFYLVYPSLDMKKEYIERYKQRNSPQAFIDLLSTKWHDWILECHYCDTGCKQLTSYKYIEEAVKDIPK